MCLLHVAMHRRIAASSRLSARRSRSVLLALQQVSYRVMWSLQCLVSLGCTLHRTRRSGDAIVVPVVVAVGVAGCVMKMGTDGTGCVAGIDGSVYNLYPRFPEVCMCGVCDAVLLVRWCVSVSLSLWFVTGCGDAAAVDARDVDAARRRLRAGVQLRRLWHRRRCHRCRRDTVAVAMHVCSLMHLDEL